MTDEDALKLPEIRCDVNAQFDFDLLFATCYGTTTDLSRLGITAESAIGMTFLFNDGLDCNPADEPADMLFVGTFVQFQDGVAIRMGPDGVFWRRLSDGAISRR